MLFVIIRGASVTITSIKSDDYLNSDIKYCYLHLEREIRLIGNIYTKRVISANNEVFQEECQQRRAGRLDDIGVGIGAPNLQSTASQRKVKHRLKRAGDRILYITFALLMSSSHSISRSRRICWRKRMNG